MGVLAEFKRSLVVQAHSHRRNRGVRVRNAITGIDVKINLIQCERFCLERGIPFERQFFENLAWSQQVNAPILVQNRPFVINSPQPSFNAGPGYGNGIYSPQPAPSAPIMDLPPSYAESQAENKRY